MAPVPVVETQQWYTLPGTSVKVPVPPRDLGVALVAVLIFLPVVVLLTRLLLSKAPTPVAASGGAAAAAKQSRRSKRE